MAMDTGAFFINVIATFIIVATFIFLILAFLYMMYGREERQATSTTAPRSKINVHETAF